MIFKPRINLHFHLAEEGGLEPPLTDSESAGLPLTYSPIFGARGESRTHTPSFRPQGLNLLCLPFHHTSIILVRVDGLEPTRTKAQNFKFCVATITPHPHIILELPGGIEPQAIHPPLNGTAQKAVGGAGSIILRLRLSR